ncbi:MAG: LytTR family transcriptional regulator DNA-binding domain-containing protein [Oligoflexia bacterium]|nr:LytTR family transcriptional regulator DNA-binding domain-containing protein [Oligoflexia bacterium]
MLTAFIADDEIFAREELKHQLSVYNDISLVGEADNGIDAVKSIRELKPDIIFLDIEMPGLKGLEVAGVLSTIQSYNPYIIVVTAYDNYAVRAFEYDIVDYVLKPIDPKRFSSSISKVLKYYGQASRMTRVSARKGNRIVLIPTEDISFVYVEDSVVFVNSGGRNYSTTYRSLDELEKELEPGEFLRTHRAYIVNLKKVREIKQLSSGLLSLKIENIDTTEVPVSRAKAKEVKNIFKI